MKPVAPICTVGMVTVLASLTPHAVTTTVSRLPTSNEVEHLLHHHRLLARTAGKAAPIPLEARVVNAVLPFWQCTFLTSSIPCVPSMLHSTSYTPIHHTESVSSNHPHITPAASLG